MTATWRAGLGLTKSEGAIVSNVKPGGPAEKAGIKRGDVIAALTAPPSPTATSCAIMSRRMQPGTKTPVSLLRNGKTATVTLAELKAAEWR